MTIWQVEVAAPAAGQTAQTLRETPASPASRIQTQKMNQSWDLDPRSDIISFIIREYKL